MLRTLKDRRFPAVLYNICRYLLIAGAPTSAKEYWQPRAVAFGKRKISSVVQVSDAACVDGTVKWS